MPRKSNAPAPANPSKHAVARIEQKIFDSTLFRRTSVKLQAVIGDLLEDCPKESSAFSMGYTKLRQASAAALLDAVDACIADGSLNPEIVRFATFCFKDGYRDIDDPLPSLKTQCDRIDRLCREFGLCAVILPDIEAVKIAG
jgi:hypothetical protein